MEEIDIIELLRLVKEGKAPKEIEVSNLLYRYGTYKGRDWYYREIENDKKSSLSLDFTLYDLLNMEIKILDKPIIPELPQINQNEYDTNSSYRSLVAYENRYKINEIIRYLNKEEK